jgi:hypothetical protein
LIGVLRRQFELDRIFASLGRPVDGNLGILLPVTFDLKALSAARKTPSLAL